MTRTGGGRTAWAPSSPSEDRSSRVPFAHRMQWRGGMQGRHAEILIRSAALRVSHGSGAAANVIFSVCGRSRVCKRKWVFFVPKCLPLNCMYLHTERHGSRKRARSWRPGRIDLAAQNLGRVPATHQPAATLTCSSLPPPHAHPLLTSGALSDHGGFWGSTPLSDLPACRRGSRRSPPDRPSIRRHYRHSHRHRPDHHRRHGPPPPPHRGGGGR